MLLLSKGEIFKALLLAEIVGGWSWYPLINFDVVDGITARFLEEEDEDEEEDGRNKEDVDVEEDLNGKSTLGPK